MKKQLLFPLQASLLTTGYLCMTSQVSQAQVTSDSTLNTVVTPNVNGVEITGGETRQSNLFHSFQGFSVPVNSEAFFNNADSINNIFSRVTGGNISNIDGAIRANGNANLFLINPAGIIFGQNARLDIGGSFYGSTADSILFDGGEFSAVNNLDAPTLTVNAPIGLNLRDNPQPIINQSIIDGLQIDPGQNLTLVGGDINFDGGIAFAPSGRIELGGLSTSGTVNFNEDLSLNFPENIARSDINFTNGSFISVASEQGGSINLNARNISLSDGSFIFGGLIPTESSFPEAQAGDVTLNATETISLDGINSITGVNSAIFNSIEAGAVGNGGDIAIDSRNLSLTNGGQIQTIVRQGNPQFEIPPGNGNAGDINLNIEDTVTVSGISEIVNINEVDASRPSFVSSSLDFGTTGESGSIFITAGSLDVNDGGAVQSSTFGFGNAGDITLDIVNDINNLKFVISNLNFCGSYTNQFRQIS